MKKAINLRLMTIMAMVLYVFWALGDQHVTVWHWLIPYLLDVILHIVQNYLANR